MTTAALLLAHEKVCQECKNPSPEFGMCSIKYVLQMMVDEPTTPKEVKGEAGA